MLIIPLILSNVLMIIWLILMFAGNEEDFKMMAYNKILDNREKIEKLEIKDKNKEDKLDEYGGISYTFMKLFLGGNSQKEINKLKKVNVEIQRGVLKHLSVLMLPGYVCVRKYSGQLNSRIRKTIYTNCLEYYGRKFVENRMHKMMANAVTYALLGSAICLLAGVIQNEDTTTSLLLMTMGPLTAVLLAYNEYSTIQGKLKARHLKIERQFPGVVSKLTLLVTSGMIMDKAWIQTAYSNNGELYLEMQKTARELENMISHEAAYADFIRRCNTKETTKLASAILQNLSKGNSEIGILLKNMSKDAWMERKHLAKRDSEKANGRLLIPTMILMMDVLMMIVVPLATNL